MAGGGCGILLRFFFCTFDFDFFFFWKSFNFSCYILLLIFSFFLTGYCRSVLAPKNGVGGGNKKDR